MKKINLLILIAACLFVQFGCTSASQTANQPNDAAKDLMQKYIADKYAPFKVKSVRHANTHIDASGKQKDFYNVLTSDGNSDKNAVLVVFDVDGKMEIREATESELKDELTVK